MDALVDYFSPIRKGRLLRIIPEQLQFSGVSFSFYRRQK
jgi:hypothetical protein